jgi:hypothetical protein
LFVCLGGLLQKKRYHFTQPVCHRILIDSF